MSTFSRPRQRSLAGALAGASMTALLLSGCDREPATPTLQTVPVTSSVSAKPALPVAINHQMLQSAWQALSSAAQDASALQERTRLFLEHPNATTLTTLRDSWRQSYSSFLQARFFGFLPISDPPDWQRERIGYRGTLALLDAWPIEGGYIDYVPGYPLSGIVNDLALDLTPASLLAQHGLTDPSSASLGFHVMEFLLWGADGQRTASDYLPHGNTAAVLDLLQDGGIDSFSGAIGIQNNERRRQYLQLVADAISEHMRRLERRWEPGAGYYATLIDRSKPSQTLTAGLQAANKLLNDEIAGKRLELISSEFSGSSRDDISALLQGLELWMLNEEEGVLKLLPGDQQSLRSQWEELLAALYTSMDPSSPMENSSQTPAHLIGQLQSLLRLTASKAGVQIGSAAPLSESAKPG